MSNRAERRAAMRSANKAANAQSAAATTTPAAMPANFPFDPDDNSTSEITLESESDTPQSTASEAQINANRENAQKSTGAKTPEGKAAVSQNRRTHGLIGRFALMSNENTADFLTLKDDVLLEYQPQTSTEWRLAQSLIQHFWLMLRAVRLQDQALVENPKMLPLYLRYHSTHERSYYRAQKELQKLVKERAQQQIGFEQQIVKQEAHQARVRLQNAKAESMEADTSCKKVMGVPIPGIANVPMKEVAEACSNAITALVYGKQLQNAAAGQ